MGLAGVGASFAKWCEHVEVHVLRHLPFAAMLTPRRLISIRRNR